MPLLAPLWRLFYSSIIDALFPLSPEEEALAALAPEDAVAALPPAPEFGSRTVPLPGVQAVFAYKDERISRLIWNIKNKKDGHAVRIGGYALWHALRATASVAPPGMKCAIVPMPITLRRRRERGYNQCELLAKEMMQLNPNGRFILAFELLIRVQHSTQQKKKDRSDRLQGAKGIFAVNEKAVAALQDKNTPIIVIDDVITTGSTIKEAIDTLRAAGYTNVSGISLAH